MIATQEKPMLNLALEYASRSWPVLPIKHPSWDSAEREKDKGKSPYSNPDYAPNGKDSATTDTETVSRWFGNGRSLNIGIRTGASSGILVVDIDGDAGREWVRKMGMFDNRQFPETYTVKSGRLDGGRHLYYRHVEGVRNSQGDDKHGVHPGVDVRAEGGYIIGAGSLHVTGNYYAVENDVPVADCPKWLADILLALERLKTAGGGADVGVEGDDPILEGARNDALKRISGSLRAQGMEYDELLQRLRQINTARCKPPKPDKEVVAFAQWVCKKPKGKKSGDTIAQCLLKIASTCTLLHSKDNRVFIQPKDRRPFELQSRGGSARNWLRAEYFRQYNTPVRDGDLTTVCDTLMALADDKKKVEVFTRIKSDMKQIVIDCGWDGNEAIVIDQDGYRIEDDHGVLFVRTEGVTAPMVRPDFDADKNTVFQTFHDLMGLSDEDSFKLICWMLQCWMPSAPYMILYLTGGAGTGKSSTTKGMRFVVDPMGDDGARFGKSPKDSQDLIAFATCCHVLAVDNVSHINRDLSDTIAGLATGMGNFTRRLYTNSEVHAVVRMVPQIINGLSPGGLQPDVKDRMLHVSLKQREHIVPAGQWWEQFRQLAPGLTGALCQACSFAMQTLAYVPMKSDFRMADAARWIAAAQPFLTQGSVWSGLDFATVYRETRATDAETVLEEDPILHQLFSLVQENGQVAGTAQQILQQVESRAARNNELDALVKSGQWPKNARAFSVKLIKFDPILRDGGIYHTEPSRREHVYSTTKGASNDLAI